MEIGRNRRLIFAVAAIVVLIILIRNAWVCDDAYITFRTVDNFVHGYGLTWNVAERAQGFTSPLWAFVVSLAYLFSGEIYFTVLFLSMLLTLAAIWVLMTKIANDVTIALLAVLALMFSKAFIDYSSSGLENALSFFLIALFLAVFLREEWTARKLLLLSLIASMAAVNRLDTILLHAPAVALAWWQVRSRRSLSVVFLGFLPLMIWELFSVVYYGFPFPNTYYAKLGSGLSHSEMFYQGLIYYMDAIWRDPLTLIIILSAMIGVLTLRRDRLTAPAVGLIAYLLYVVFIGGDFMSGRFFALPVFLAVMILSAAAKSVSGRSQAVLATAVIAIGLLGTQPPPLSGASFGSTEEDRQIAVNGICDERGYYYQETGLLHARRHVTMPNHRWALRGKDARASHLTSLFTSVVGFTGFYAGPGVHIVDPMALADPLLARLPAEKAALWRTGHLLREVPEGYQATIEQKKNMITDSSLAGFYDKLCIVTRGPVWSTQRFKEILNFNLGRYDYLVEQYERRPDMSVRFANMNAPRAQGSEWNAEGNYVVHNRGLMVKFDSRQSVDRIELSVDNNDEYSLRYYFDSLLLGSQEIESRTIIGGGLRIDTVSVPEDAQSKGFNALLIRPSGGDSKYSIGHVRLLDRQDL